MVHRAAYVEINKVSRFVPNTVNAKQAGVNVCYRKLAVNG
jgi:hypothetical protein